MIEKLERMAMLFDFYGSLLTEKQQEMLSLYYEQDLSLGEIAEEYKVSRQAVYDILKRGEKTLEEYDNKLGLIKKFTAERQKLADALDLLDRLKAKGESDLREKIKQALNEIIEGFYV
ncbi:MAG: putative DNA-binding protein [Firmicutes bacterium HGW-Firmicutes-8]|nr:MAG: putative DNA-binding protein [Firmicutes bacterium HGW-Firmicutes-8]